MTTGDRLMCANGSPWGRYGCGTKEQPSCAGCRAEADRMQAEFWRDVFFGRYDRFGYTPADREAQQARKVAAV